MKFLTALGSTILLSAAATASAQSAKPVDAPPPPNAENRSPNRADAGASMLSQRFSITAAQAQERIDLQEEISRLSQSLAEANPDSFGGIWVEHEPTYKIIVAFNDSSDRTALRQSVSPTLRRYLQILPVRRSLKSIRDDQAIILSALASAGVEMTISYEPKSQKFQLDVADPAQGDRLRDLVPPSLRADVQVRRGLSTREVQSGVQSGDALYGGWGYYDSAGNPNCTFAFVTRSHEGKDAILTASNNHCSVTTPYVGQTTHWVVLPAAYYSQSNTASGITYDFRAHVITGLVNGPYVYFTNNQPVRGYTQYVNSVPNMASSGYFTVTGAVSNSTSSNYGYFIGMAICKSGNRTGLTCGQVTSTSASGTSIGNSGTTTYSGLIRVGQSNQSVNAYSGDSGGAVFTAPDSTSRIKAAGIMKSAETINGSPCYRGSGYDCGYFFMPTDRINDVYPMQIKTETGTVNP